MMKELFASHAVGWVVLSALLVSAGHLAGCDSSATSQKKTEAETKHDDGKNAPTDKSAQKTPAQDQHEKSLEQPADEKKQADESDKKAETSEETSDVAPVVKRLVIASEIKEREPVELTDAKVAEPVVAFVEFKNAEDIETGVIVTFEHEGGHKVGFVELNIPGNSPRYRTWARTRNIKKSGEWTAVVKSKSGEELARKTFQVTG